MPAPDPRDAGRRNRGSAAAGFNFSTFAFDDASWLADREMLPDDRKESAIPFLECALAPLTRNIAGSSFASATLTSRAFKAARTRSTGCPAVSISTPTRYASGPGNPLLARGTDLCEDRYIRKDIPYFLAASKCLSRSLRTSRPTARVCPCLTHQIHNRRRFRSN